MLDYESQLESALQIYRSLDRSITTAKLFGTDPEYITTTELEELRDEALPDDRLLLRGSHRCC
jgi:hypothetical protein